MALCVCLPGEECPSWMVPISICTSEDAKCCKLKVLLDRPETTITVSGVGPDQWVKVTLTSAYNLNENRKNREA